MVNEFLPIGDLRLCPFDGQLVVCDGDCDCCDWAEDEDDDE